MITAEPAGTVRLAPVTRDDRDRIRRWLASGAIRAWWGPAGAVEAGGVAPGPDAPGPEADAGSGVLGAEPG